MFFSNYIVKVKLGIFCYEINFFLENEYFLLNIAQEYFGVWFVKIVKFEIIVRIFNRVSRILTLSQCMCPCPWLLMMFSSASSVSPSAVTTGRYSGAPMMVVSTSMTEAVTSGVTRFWLTRPM